MSYQEKKLIAGIVTGLLVVAAYCVYAFGIDQSARDLKGWAVTMLVFIGIGVGAAIVMQIIFHIVFAAALAVREGCDKRVEAEMEACMVEDEMVKLIELKSVRSGYAVAGIGFVAGLVALVLGAAPAVMLNIVFLSCSAGSVAEGFSGLYYYRRGVNNG